LLDGFASGRLRVPNYTLMNALANCCRDHPRVLIRYFYGGTGHKRELLARVLAEIAGPDLGEELLTLAVDELPEVRASAARALGHVQQLFALWALDKLVEDPEWFVRLRAVVALGSIKEMGRIPSLLKAICDCNRMVRQRAAWVLARIEPNLLGILQQVVDTNDNYALQAFISELERSGGMEKITWALEGQSRSQEAQSVLATALSKARAGLDGARITLAAAAGANR
jgi:HEAT repeat protein